MFGLTGLKTVPTERAQGTLHGMLQARLLGVGVGAEKRRTLVWAEGNRTENGLGPQALGGSKVSS